MKLIKFEETCSSNYENVKLYVHNSEKEYFNSLSFITYCM